MKPISVLVADEGKGENKPSASGEVRLFFGTPESYQMPKR